MPHRLARAAVCLIAAALASAAQAQPLPQPRPVPATEEPSAASQPVAPLPRPRPPTAATDGAPSDSEPSEDGAGAAEAPQPATDPPPPADAGQEVACRERLGELGVEYEEVGLIDGVGACGAAAPIRVTELGGGIDLTPPATLNCQAAEALAHWAQEVVRPAAERHLDATPTTFVNAASYVCRPRNNRPGAKLSEHARANAIDIGGIAFAEDDPVPILLRSDEAAREKAFQRAIRRGACEHFTTVIGPGTNAAHATHFHFDLAERRGGYRLCE